MEIKYTNNLKLGPGHGYFIISGEQLTSGHYAISCQRGVDQLYLNADGEWQEYGTTINLVGNWEESQASLYLALSPIIVDALSVSDIYRVFLFSQDVSRQSLNGRLKIEEIIYSQGKTLNSAVILPDLDLQPESEPTIVHPQKVIEHEPKTVEETLSLDDLERSPEPKVVKKHSLWPILLISLIILVVLGYFVWDKWFRDSDSSQDTVKPTLDEPAEKEDKSHTPSIDQLFPSQDEHKPSPEKNPISGGRVNRPILSAEEQVRRFFKGPERTPAKAAALAKSIEAKTPEAQDAIFRLYYFAATHGEKSVLMPYAACLDPTKPAWGTIKKNAVEAYNLYKTEDTPQSKAAIRNLKQWLEKEKSRGNLEASEWLNSLSIK